MWRYSKCNLTPDKELNIIVYDTPFYVIMYRSNNVYHVVRLSQRDRAAGWVSFGLK